MLIILAAAAGIFLFIMLLVFVAVAAPLSVFIHVEETDLKGSELVRQVEYYTQCWEDAYRLKLEQDKASLEKENTHWVSDEVAVFDIVTNQWIYEEVWKEECSVEVYIQTYTPDMGYFYAYVCTENAYTPESMTKEYMPAEDDISAVYDMISEDVCEITQEEKDIYRLCNRILNLQETKQVFYPDNAAKQLFFENSYNLICEILELSADAPGFDADTISPNGMDIPLYLQYQSPWGNKTYGDGRIAETGCGPTCLAMVISYLTGTRVTPSDVTEWAGSRYYVNGQGTAWSIYPDAALQWGLGCKVIGKKAQEIAAELENGHPVILSMGPGRFTSTGHFIVLRGIEADGSVYVNDPNDSTGKGFYDMTFSLEAILKEAKGAWSFY